MASSIVLSSDEGESFEVDKILDVRKRGKTTQYLVKWKGYDSDEETWESEKNLVGSQAAIEEFNRTQESVKTPGRRRLTKQTNTVTVDQDKGEKSIRQTTTVTTVTRTVSGAQSESSSPESSPVLGRKTLATHTVIKKTRQTTSKPDSAKTSQCWLQLPCCLGTARRCCEMDFPSMLVLLCFLFIVLTFVIQPSK